MLLIVYMLPLDMETQTNGIMKSVSDQIKSAIASKIRISGLASLPATLKRDRPVGCPMKSSMIESLQSLTNHEIHIAFHFGLIGNSNKPGSIVANSKF